MRKLHFREQQKKFSRLLLLLPSQRQHPSTHMVSLISIFKTAPRPFRYTGREGMPRPQQRETEEGSSFLTMLIEQGWLAFVILGIFMIGLRLYNVKQRKQQRQLLREGLMAEMGYKKAKDIKQD